MRSVALSWYRLRWPREVIAEQVVQVFRLLATTAGQPVVIEAVGSAGVVEHRVALPAGRAESVVDQLRATVPGLSVEAIAERPAVGVTHAVELRLTTKRRPLRTDDAAGVNRAILTALAHLRRGEHLTLQWVLSRPLAPVAVPNHLEGLGRESWLGALLVAPFGSPLPADVDVRNACVPSRASRAGGQLGVSP